MMKPILSLILGFFIDQSVAWLPHRPPQQRTGLSMAKVGIFYGTSTGSTQSVADLIYNAFGSDIAAEPVDVDTLEAEGSSLAKAFGQHDALIVGTPTWNTGADTERSGTGWDELYYKQLPSIKNVLKGKNVAVFGLGDQVSYSENYADATGELFDVFEGMGCKMMGAWSQEGYSHDDSKSIRGDKFCGLLLDMVNQEDLTEERVEKWVAQLTAEGFLKGGAGNSVPQQSAVEEPLQTKLEEHSDLLDESITKHSSGGFTAHTNIAKGKTMWVTPDGRQSFVTTVKRPPIQKFSP